MGRRGGRTERRIDEVLSGAAVLMAAGRATTPAVRSERRANMLMKVGRWSDGGDG